MRLPLVAATLVQTVICVVLAVVSAFKMGLGVADVVEHGA